MEIRTYTDTDFAGIDALWNEAFPNDPPWNRAAHSVPAKTSFQPELLFVAVNHGVVVGSAMAGYDGHRGWLYAVAVSQSHRRSGLGTKLVRKAEEALVSLGCGKINLQVHSANRQVVQFYEGLGYEVEDRVSLGRRVG